MPAKRSLRLRLLNIVVTLTATWLLLLTSILLFSRKQHEETSRWLYGADSPLMNSAFLEAFVTPVFGVIFIAMAVICVAKEGFLKFSIRTRAFINVGLLVISGLVFVLLSQSLVTPPMAIHS